MRGISLSLPYGGNPNKNRSKVTRTLPETQGQNQLTGVLASIIATKRSELVELCHRADTLEEALASAPAIRDFRAALAQSGTVSLIAECKRRSPGAGEIRPEMDPAALMRGYQQVGASALSVLTDVTYFGGSLQDLTAVSEATQIPVLRKDFTLDTLQVIEGRSAGADAVLLIVRVLDDVALEALHREASGLGMGVLVEVHDAHELERAVRLGAAIIGINNRDLATFTTDVHTTFRLLEQLPDDVIVVSESGIRGRGDVQLLGEWGVDAILVGEWLLRASDPVHEARSLCGVPTRDLRRG